MKKLLITISASLLLVIGAKAQVADLNFDSTWTPDVAGSLSDARGWTSFNTASTPPYSMAQTVFRVTNNPAFGVASAKIETEKMPAGLSVPNPFRPFHNFDTVGLACLGKINLLPPGLTFGAAIAISRPSYLTFSSKDSAMAGDSAFVLAYLTKWNSVTMPHKLDTISSGKWGESSAGSAWASHTITMNYNPLYSAVIPDSQQIFVSSSIYMRGGAKIGSKYYVDAFCWDCQAGIKEYQDNASIAVFPNPTSNEINFNSTVNASYVEVMDITGRKLGMYLMQNNKVKVQTESLTSGFYLYDVLNEKKEIISRGKFEVSK